MELGALEGAISGLAIGLMGVTTAILVPVVEWVMSYFSMLRDFTAIDFETANRYPTSACSIGIVVVQDGEITEEFSHLIKPEPYYFNKKFIEIHGLLPRWWKMRLVL